MRDHRPADLQLTIAEAVKAAFAYSHEASEADRYCRLGHHACATVEGGACAAARLAGARDRVATIDTDLAYTATLDELEGWADEVLADRPDRTGITCLLAGWIAFGILLPLALA